jgi:general secretion pathway protein B
MSFILDALKKMEGEVATKGAGAIPPPPPRPLSGRKKSLLLALVTATLALNILAVVLWLGERERADERGGGKNVVRTVERPFPVAAATMAVPPAAVPEAEIPVTSPEPVVPGAGETVQGGEETAQVTSGRRSAVEKPVAAESSLPPTAQEIAALDARPATEEVSAGEERATYDGSVLAVEELPGDLRPGVAALRISAHVYSNDPAFRRVAVNDNLKREGDVVAAGLVVEEITERGAVFRYRGYRFRMETR